MTLNRVRIVMQTHSVGMYPYKWRGSRSGLYVEFAELDIAVGGEVKQQRGDGVSLEA